MAGKKRDPGADIARGERARAILDDPVFQETFEIVRAGLLSTWENAPVKDTEARERAWMAVKLLTRLRAELEQFTTSGKFAAAEALRVASERRKKGTDA